jgi:hypothetical protein
MHTRACKRQDASRFDGIGATSHSCLQRKQQHARAPKRAARHTAICGQLLILVGTYHHDVVLVVGKGLRVISLSSASGEGWVC